jgi:hypothetical protein
MIPTWQAAQARSSNRAHRVWTRPTPGMTRLATAMRIGPTGAAAPDIFQGS